MVKVTGKLAFRLPFLTKLLTDIHISQMHTSEKFQLKQWPAYGYKILLMGFLRLDDIRNSFDNLDYLPS